MLKAKTSWEEGFLGRSRVCARRAAVILIRAWLDSLQIQYPNVDGFRLLLWALENENLPHGSKERLSHLVQRVDENYNLPAGISIIDDVNSLLEYLSIELEKE